MASSLTGLTIASRALTAAQTAIYVSNANVSGASNTAVSRQTVTTTAGAGTAAATDSRLKVSSGVVVASIERQRESALDAEYREKTAAYEEWYIKSKSLTEVEGIFNEPSDTGLSAQLTDLAEALEVVSASPESEAARTAIVEKASALCTAFNETAEKLMVLQDSLNDTVAARTEEINSLADQIAYLNGQIRAVTLTGGSANALCDQQDALIDRLSEITAVTAVRSEADSQCQVLLNGYPLVKGSDTNRLATEADGTLADGSPAWQVVWQDSGRAVTFTGGELKGVLDLRDGDGEAVAYNGVPAYLAGLDQLARDTAQLYNLGVAYDGTDLGTGFAEGYTESGETGICLFGVSGGASAAMTDYSLVTAANISLSAEIQADSSRLGVSDAAGQSGNGNVALSLLSALDNTQATADGTLSDALTGILTLEGATAERAVKMESHTLELQTNAQSKRLSVMGVSVDEESLLLSEQEKIYNAAAKMISVWNDILSVTIQVLGG